MVMASDALSQSRARGEAGWGGARQKTWHQSGKRGVVNVDPQVYELLQALAKVCGRSNRDMCSQVFAAGMEALMGHPIQDLRTRKFMVTLQGLRPHTKAFSHDEVKERAALIHILPREEPEADPEFDEDPE